MNDQSKLFSLRYIGGRFDNARLPVEVLSDLAALRDLIAAFAKQEFLQKNPDRKRLPQGFGKAISFSLVNVKEGSAIPVLYLENEVAQQSIPNIGDQMEEIVDRAYTRITEIYDDATRDNFPQVLPPDAIRALSKLGANIQDEEQIEFQGQKGQDGNPVCIDFHRRKNLLTRVRETYTREFEGIGELTAIDTTNNFIKVKTEQYGELQLSLEDGGQQVKQFDGHLLSLVEFSISIELDAHDKFKSVEEVYSVDLIQAHDAAVMKCLKRLHDLSKIEKGWLGDGQGEQVVHLAGLRATQIIFMRADLAELFRIYPTENGGISLEFDKDTWSFAVEIMPEGPVEIDGSSKDGEVFEARSFEELSREFFEEFDRMISVVSNENEKD